MQKKILLADSDRKLHQRIKQNTTSKQYHFQCAISGIEALEKIEHFQPHLIVVELLLPHIHGIEILKKVRRDFCSKNIGVILIGDNVLEQNHQAALRNGCDYFLEKPFDLAFLFSALSRFFQGKLSPAPL